ncbi:Ran guanine nucleotide release factor [Plasmodiophora brassicae]|uniref:Ran guanine nucleotide release factor n=2 Tax=Plasmodiophora brassicae TaxID=37360 RepID=A0A3P3YC49_PLABS|nr:unnamed protein product [Plasmodiophora brassicae]
MMNTRTLYGGAFTIDVPASLVDVSQFRQVPDHQEVFACADTDQSVIVEIVDRSEVADSDCAKYYFQDLAEVNSAIASDTADTGDVQTCQGHTATYVIGHQTVAKFKDAPSAANQVEVYLGVIRLAEYGADILLTLNSPTSISPESSSRHCLTPDARITRDIAAEVFRSFTIVNADSLFGERP